MLTFIIKLLEHDTNAKIILECASSWEALQIGHNMEPSLRWMEMRFQLLTDIFTAIALSNSRGDKVLRALKLSQKKDVIYNVCDYYLGTGVSVKCFRYMPLEFQSGFNAVGLAWKLVRSRLKLN